MNNYRFFWNGLYSNWDIKPFKCFGLDFNCGEQAMMWFKADLFGDTEMASQILNTSDPRTIKAMGRKVKNFDIQYWNDYNMFMMINIAYAKYHTLFTAGNSEIKNIKPGTLFCEASPFDQVWGIGLGENDPKAQKQATWQGENKLGLAWTAATSMWNLHGNEHPIIEHGEIHIDDTDKALELAIELFKEKKLCE